MDNDRTALMRTDARLANTPGMTVTTGAIGLWAGVIPRGTNRPLNSRAGQPDTNG
jgi:hypothetical protein